MTTETRSPQHVSAARTAALQPKTHAERLGDLDRYKEDAGMVLALREQLEEAEKKLAKDIERLEGSDPLQMFPPWSRTPTG